MEEKKKLKTIQNDYGMRHIHKYYKKYIRTKHRNKADTFVKGVNYRILHRGTFGGIIRDFFKAIEYKQIHEAYEYKSPARMGTFNIRKFKQKIKTHSDGTLDTSHLAIDWFKTKKLWADNPDLGKKKVVYFDNSHSDYYIMRHFWSRITCTATNKTAYGFKPVDQHKDELSKAIFDKNNKIQYVDHTFIPKKNKTK